MHPFVFNTTASLVFAPGAARRLGEIAAARLGGVVLFVTDPGLRRLGLCDAAIAALLQAGTRVEVFDAVEADPSLATLTKAVELGRTAGATGIVGFGGGSSLDVAKLAALLLGSGEDIDAAWGVGNARGPRLPLVLLPTTAGTGSEVTPVSIITVGDNEKRGVSSPVLLPDIAILDAELTLGLPPAITAATGLDAMVHAIEAYASKNANNNPLSRLLARQALRLLAANIETVIAKGDDIAARGNMLLGAMLAGQAFANSPVAAVHALAYPIGGRFHVPHGLPTRWCCPTSCASTPPRQPRSTPKSPRTPFPTWRRSRILGYAAHASSKSWPRSRPASASSSACATSASPRTPSPPWPPTPCSSNACWSTIHGS